MVKTEILNERLKRTFSDSGKVIRKIGTQEEYSEAVDLITATYEYEETEKDIAPKKEQTEVE